VVVTAFSSAGGEHCSYLGVFFHPLAGREGRLIKNLGLVVAGLKTGRQLGQAEIEAQWDYAMEELRILALSGSLRKASHNSAALIALQYIAPGDIKIEIGSIATLPLFNPDLEEKPPLSVKQLKEELSKSDGLVLATPEYAHGISGPMKNALDWLVSGVEFPGKPIMLINTSPRASHAQASLQEILRTMSAEVVDSAFVSLPLLGSDLNSDNICQTASVTAALRSGLIEFAGQIRARET